MNPKQHELTKILESLFAPLMFAGFHNQFRLLTMVKQYVNSTHYIIHPVEKKNTQKKTGL